MAKGNFPACLAVTLTHEGEWSDHPSDPGGATMKGITLATYRRYRPGALKTHLRNISDSEVRAIYQDGYWNPVRGEELPAGVDLATFDYAVNSGPSRSVKELQRVTGAKVDGKAGPETVAKAAAGDGKAVIQGLCARRMSFLQGLKTWATFKRGWSRRVADVEAKAVAMWLRSESVNPSAVSAILKGEAGEANGKASSQNKSAGATAGGGAAVGGGDVALSSDPNAILLVIVGLVLVGALVLFLKARHNKERAAAYLATA